MFELAVCSSSLRQKVLFLSDDKLNGNNGLQESISCVHCNHSDHAFVLLVNIIL